MPPRRRRGSSGLIPVLLLIVLAVPVLGVAGLYLFVDPNAFKPRIIEAVRLATGRELSLRGPLSLRLALAPTIRAEDVGLSNAPGGSRPDMVTIRAVQATLALWPLLDGRVEIRQLDVEDPDVLLEKDSAGAGNWRMTGQGAAASSGPAAAGPSAPAAPPSIAVGDLRVTGGRVTWLASGPRRVVEIASLRAMEGNPAAPISATAELKIDGQPVSVSAELGSLARLLNEAAGGAPWPAQFVARVAGSRLSVSGTVAQPLRGAGYQFTAEASLPELAPIGVRLGVALPALRDVTLSARLDDGTGVPTLSALSFHGGPADLAAYLPGLALERVEVLAPAMDQPVHVAFDGAIAGPEGGPVRLSGETGTLTQLISGAGVMVNLTAELGGARLSGKGSIAAPMALSGFDLAIEATVPDLAALGGLIHEALPPFTEIAAAARLSDQGHGFVLRNVTLTAPQGDLAGEFAVVTAPSRAVLGQMTGAKLDLDGVQAILSKAPRPAEPPPASAPPKPASADTARPAKLAGADLDLRLAMGEIRSGGIVYRDLSGHLLLAGGRLTIDPFSATLPGGKLDGKLSAALDEAEPKVTATLHAPGLALKPLLTAFGQPAEVSGTLDIDADLTATGRTRHSLARSLTGRLGLVMTDGDLDNRLLGATLGTILKVARLPAELFGDGAGNGRTHIRCFAMRLDSTNGAATIPALVLDSPRFLVTGSGSANLADETLALRLRPMLRTGGPGVVVPVRLSGPFHGLSATLDGGGAIEGVASSVTGGITSGLSGLGALVRNPVQTVTGLVAGERGGDSCQPAINAARGARPK